MEVRVKNPDTYLILILILGISVFIAQAYFVSKVNYVGSLDLQHFANVAGNFLKGNGFTLDYIDEFFVRFSSISHPEEWGFSGASLIISPFILLFGKTAFAVKLPNMIIGAILFPIVVYFMGKEMFDRKIGFLAAASMLFYPLIFPVSFGGERDTMFAFLLFLGFYLFYKGLKTKDYFYPMGVVLGFAFLVRPTAVIVFPALVLIYYLIEKKFSREFLFGLALSALIMSPWLLRNQLIFGDPLFTPNRYEVWINDYFRYEESLWFHVYWGGAMSELPSISWMAKILGGYTYFAKALSSLASQLVSFFALNILAFLGVAIAAKRKITGRIKLWMWFLIWLAFVAAALVVYRAQIRNPVILPLRAFPYAAILLTSLFLFTKGSEKNTMFVVLWGTFAAFFSFYWSPETRYFLPVIPFLLIFSWMAARRLLNYMTEKVPMLKKIGVERMLMIILIIFILVSVPQTFGKFFEMHAPFPYQDDNPSKLTLYMADKIKAVTNPDDVIMGCDAGVLNFYTGRKTVEFPSDTFANTVLIMKTYNVSYLSFMGCEARVINPDFLRVFFREYPPPGGYYLGLYSVNMSEELIDGEKTLIISGRWAGPEIKN